MFRLRMNATGETERDEQINISRKYLESNFNKDPSFKKNIEIFEKGYIDARINNYRRDGTTAPKMDIQSTLDNDFDMGDLFIIDGNYWLCTMKNNFHDIYNRGLLLQCNQILKFQNPDDIEAIIHSIPCVCERPYSSTIDIGTIINVANKQYKVSMPLNNITEKIFLKKRFMLESGFDSEGNILPYIYNVVSYDSISQTEHGKGFLLLTFEQDQYNTKTDRADLGIADYREPEEIKPIIPGFATIKAPEFTVKLGCGFRTFTGKIFDNNGIEIIDYSDIEFSWRINQSDIQKDSLVAEFKSNDSICKIKCKSSNNEKENDLLLFSTFDLILSAENISTESPFNYGEIRETVEIIPLI